MNGPPGVLGTGPSPGWMKPAAAALFGPVFAAAVVLDPERPIRGLDDSKQLAAGAARGPGRSESGSAPGPGPWRAADAFEIDHWNILQAARLAMRRAVEQLPAPCDYLLVDAVHVDLPLPQKALIHGDALCFSIAAASILAKVARDAALEAWDAVFPQYGFKGQ